MTTKYEELLKEYRKLAKRADQRLVRIEKEYSKKKGYEEITQFAYRVAMRDIKSWSGEGSRRFNTAPPKNTNALKAKIADIKKFLGSQSSTLSGIKKTYDKRTASINRKFGTDLSSAELKEFFDSSLWKKLDAQFYGDVSLRTAGVLQANQDQIAKAIREHKTVHVQIVEHIDDQGNTTQETVISDKRVDGKHDIVLEEAIKKALHYYRKDISKFFGFID